MGLRADKKHVLEIAAEHFKQFKVPLSIEQKSMFHVGPTMAVSAISVKEVLKTWSILLQH